MATGGHAERLTPETRAGAFPPPGSVTQFYVFRGEDFLGWDCFQKESVVIGSGPGADLVLDAPELADAQVVVQCTGSQILVHDLAGNGLVHINGEPCTACLLGPLDVLGVGPYALKVRAKSVRRQVTEPPPRPRAVPRPAAPVEPAIPAPRPERVRPEAPAAAELPAPQPASPPRAVAAPMLPDIDGEELLAALEPVGEPALEEAAEPNSPAPAPPARAAAPQPPATPAKTPGPVVALVPPPTAEASTLRPEPARPDPVARLRAATWLGGGHEDDDEEDEPDEDAPFTLLDRLAPQAPAPRAGAPSLSVLQVLKVRSGHVVDCRTLEPGQEYRDGPSRRAPLVASADQRRTGFVYLTQGEDQATVRSLDGRVFGADALFRPEHRVHKRRPVYRCPLPEWGQAVVARGHTRYYVRQMEAIPDLAVAEPPRNRRGPVRSLLTSSLVHALALCLGALFVSLPSPYEAPAPETRFVQIETKDLEPLLQPKRPPVRPTEALEPAPAKPAPKPRAKPAVVRPSETAVAQEVPPEATQPPPPPAPAEEVAAAPPEAVDTGGGHGGNALNRNVKQAGILGALGLPDGVNLGAGEALAAVTNIDAVPSARAGEATLKVGGLVGKLGSSRIEVPAVGLVNTKGSTQVVASAGASGGGAVAALEKGTTGARQVQALVSADLKAPVTIQGGMSREEVKRVIDQHMDEVTYCYETSLIVDPALMGKMTFEWRILETGRVGEVRIQSSSVRSETLHSCIRDRIRGWQFPRPRGAEVLVSYPFVFDVVGF